MNRQIQRLTELVRIEMGVLAVFNTVQSFGVFQSCKGYQSKGELQNEPGLNRYIDNILKEKAEKK